MKNALTFGRRKSSCDEEQVRLWHKCTNILYCKCMDNDISYTVSQGYLRVSFICSGTGGRKHILCIIHHILCIITEGCHRVSFVCSGISGRKHILCIIHHIIYCNTKLSQSFCSGTGWRKQQCTRGFWDWLRGEEICFQEEERVNEAHFKNKERLKKSIEQLLWWAKSGTEGPLQKYSVLN